MDRRVRKSPRDLIALRKALSASREDLAGVLDVDPEAVAAYETGGTPAPRWYAWALRGLLAGYRGAALRRTKHLPAPDTDDEAARRELADLLRREAVPRTMQLAHTLDRRPEQIERILEAEPFIRTLYTAHEAREEIARRTKRPLSRPAFYLLREAAGAGHIPEGNATTGWRYTDDDIDLMSQWRRDHPRGRPSGT